MPDVVRNIQLVFDEASGIFDSTTQTLNVSATISWLPPLLLYGVLQDYSVTVQDLSRITVFMDPSIPPSTTSVTSVVQVSPVTGYTVTVNATTGGGVSSDTSSSFASPESGEMLARALGMVAQLQDTLEWYQ